MQNSNLPLPNGLPRPQRKQISQSNSLGFNQALDVDAVEIAESINLGFDKELEELLVAKARASVILGEQGTRLRAYIFQSDVQTFLTSQGLEPIRGKVYPVQLDSLHWHLLGNYALENNVEF